MNLIDITTKDTKIPRFATTLLLLAMMLTIPALVHADGPYEITCHTIDGGGGTSTGGLYLLTGTIAQPDADWCECGTHSLMAYILLNRQVRAISSAQEVQGSLMP